MKTPEEESKNSSSNKKIRFNIFEYISNWSNHSIRNLKGGKSSSNCKIMKSYEGKGNIYISKRLVLIE